MLCLVWGENIYIFKSTYNNDASYNDSTLDSVKEGIQFGDSVFSSSLIK